MRPSDAILAGVNGHLGYLAMLRELLAYPGWRVQLSPSVWLFSSDEARDTAVAAFAEAVGASQEVAVLEDILAELDPEVVELRIDPGSPISLTIETSHLDAFRRIARSARVERALERGDRTSIKRYDTYFVPYFGEFGRAHQVIALPTPHGKMIAAFTGEDRVDTFLATGNDIDRANVKFVKLDGEKLFGSAESIAEGVIVNFGSEHPIGFNLDACREIIAA